MWGFLFLRMALIPTTRINVMINECHAHYGYTPMTHYFLIYDRETFFGSPL